MTFLERLEQLRYKTPRLYNINVGCENSDYCTHADKDKNCYLIFAANYCEDSMYGGFVVSSRDCTDCSYCDKSELCYECIDIEGCYNCNCCQNLKNCTDCAFSYDLIGCKDCFGCAGLRQKQYCFFNEQLTKEEYQKRIRGFDFKNPEHIQFALNKFNETKYKTPRIFAWLTGSENCLGDNLTQSKNCYMCFDVFESQDSMYVNDSYRTKDSSDIMFSDGSELCYECFSLGLGTYNCNFSNYIRTSSDCEYSELLFNCKHCFGCIGLQSKEYYILNTPYSKEDYFKKVIEIKEEMKKSGVYGKMLGTTYNFEDTAASYLT